MKCTKCGHDIEDDMVMFCGMPVLEASTRIQDAWRTEKQLAELRAAAGEGLDALLSLLGEDNGVRVQECCERAVRLQNALAASEGK